MMRPGQGKQRMRGRHRGGKGGGGGGGNPLQRSYESNGPDVKIRGTAQHIVEKYAQLARDAQASDDHVLAESYLQHAEHYVGSSRVDLQACKLEYSIVSPK